uniref:Uncharacterized protein n=1 Tax=Manihot esculenta TaxID=3983 RepID=A0A2C9VM16_MANES
MICVPEGGSMAMRDWNCHGPMLFGGCRCCFIGALFSFHSLLDSPVGLFSLEFGLLYICDYLLSALVDFISLIVLFYFNCSGGCVN